MPFLLEKRRGKRKKHHIVKICMSEPVAICDEIGESHEGDVVLVGYQKALEIWRGNIAPLGFKASRERYNSIWGRDTSIT